MIFLIIKKTLLASTAFLLVMLSLSFQPICASEKVLTRGDMAVMFSATEFMKEKIGQLMNFSVGYSMPSFNRATLAPVMKYIKIDPDKILLDKNLLFKMMVSVDNPGGLSEIEEVKLDAESLGKPLDLKMVDNGLWGDEVANDGIFTLQEKVSPNIDPGEKEITVSVINKKGWMSVARAGVQVEKLQKQNVEIEALANPNRIKSGENSKVVFTVRLPNFQGDDSTLTAYADLSSLGYGDKVQMKKNRKTFYLEINMSGISSGTKIVPIKIYDASGSSFSAEIKVDIAR